MKRRVEQDIWQRVIADLKDVRGFAFDEGLSDTEITAAEFRFRFCFPPDLRAFLQAELPSGPSFPNWRAGDEAGLRDWLDLPRRGVVFDVLYNGFWLPEWGPRPTDPAAAVRTAEALVAEAPRLIPVYAHRMIPDEPRTAGNPVFSVHQTDIIPYGHDLLHYLREEFGVARWWTPPSEPRPIRFWELDRFQDVRWRDGSCVFDNSRGTLPQDTSES
jgi:hypothetical protein